MCKIERIRIGLWALGLLVASGPAWALESDRDQPVEITADSAEMDETKGVSVYRGKVEVRQGSMRLFADEVTIRHPDNKAQRIEAVGKPVRFSQLLDNQPKGQPKDQPKELHAQALRAEYDINGDELQLIDAAEVRQGEDSFRSDRITYDRKRGLVRGGASAKGKERVQVTVKPNRQ